MNWSTPSPRSRQFRLGVILVLSGWFCIDYSYQHGLVLPSSPIFDWLGGLLIVVGILIRLLAIQQIPCTYQIGNLATRGIYSRTRNPIYFGFLLVVVGVAIYSRALLAFGWAVFGVVLLYGVAKLEERDLERAFGEKYLAYKQRVPAMIPRLWK